MNESEESRPEAAGSVPPKSPPPNPFQADPLQADSSDERPIDAPLNPYAPSAIEDDPTLQAEMLGKTRSEEPDAPLTLTRTAVRWCAVCGLSAIPSFVFGMIATSGQVAGMLVGIAIFAAGYTLLDFRTAHWSVRKRRDVRRTLKIAYGTRVTISIVFPVGAYLDMICGIGTLAISESLFGQGFTSIDSGVTTAFFPAVFATLLQGVILNVLLAFYAGVVHLIQLAILALTKP